MVSVSVDRNSPVPLYFQIAQQLEQAIDSGVLEPGSRLDNEIELSEQYAVSRPTLRRAIEHLTDQGLLVRRRGVGTVVVPRRVKRPVALSSLYDDLSAAHREPATEVLDLRAESAEASVAATLGVPEGSPVTVIDRVRYADGAPLAVMHNELPGEIVKLTADMLEGGGLYELLRAKGIQLGVANQTIGARTATTREAQLLNAVPGSPVLTMNRTAYSVHGVAVEYGSHAYLAQRYSFEMSLVSR